MDNTTTHEIQLAIYDLSQGMARSLSTQFLGPNHSIDIIPHTAILAYGREYYFGAGIACDDPQTFRRTRRMQPIEIRTLGRTRSSRAEFDAWCAHVTRDGTYGPASYDLMGRNCNNFSHDAALRGLNLDRGVPEWILGVPERFLSSPMGQMIRPMLEQMQVTGPGPDSATGSNFVSSAAGGSGSGNGGSSKSQHSGDSVAVNPWGHLGTPSPPHTSEPKSSPAAEQQMEATHTISYKNQMPALLQYTRPLISNDTKMVDICVAKLTTNDDEYEKDLLIRLGNELKEPNSLLDGDATKLLVENWKKGKMHALYSLILLRLVVLHPLTKNIGIVQNIGATLTGNSDDTEDQSNAINSAAVRSMAWCVLSNAVGSNLNEIATTLNTEKGTLEKLVDAALLDLVPERQGRVEVRQSASAFLYNLIVVDKSLGIVECTNDGGGDEIPDMIVTLLCGAMEGLNDEPDLTTKIRRVLVVGKILCPLFDEESEQGTDIGVNTMAVRLVNDLGFTNTLTALSLEIVKPNDDSKKLAVLVNEILPVLRSI